VAPSSDRRKSVCDHRAQPDGCRKACTAVLLFLSIVKLICEIALLALFGQGLLFILAGPKRDSNVFYQLLKLLTNPFTRPTRLITPRQVSDQHVPFVTFFFLLLVWGVVTFEKISLCISLNMVGCR
jgi:hypothetical protein